MYQSMNEFGIPYTEAEESMRPNGIGHRHIDKQLAGSGVELGFWNFVGAAVGIAGAIIGGNKASSAAKKQAQAQNDAADRQLAYDTEQWNMMKEKIVADRDHAAKVIELQAANEEKLASWRDATNLQKYNYDLMIREKEQQSLDAQFAKSTDIYNKQISFNDISEKTARENEYQKLQEIEAEIRFDNEDAYIQMLQTKGKMNAIGSTGRSAQKGVQSTLGDYGRQVLLFNKSIASAGSATKSALKEIQQDKTSADLAAYGAKMLDPGILPEPIQPLVSPVSEFIYPRDIGEYDFGPEPVAGAYTSPSAAANQVWGSVIPGIAGQAGSYLATIK